MKDKEAELLGKTGERMVPHLHGGSLIYAEHILRYQAAQDLVAGKVVLDVASGSGYGTQLLAKKAKKVYGVDIDKDSVKYATKIYGGKNIEFKVGDGESIPLPTASVDVVTTFETIEHVKNYKQFLDEIKRVLKPDGLAIVSTPNDLEFAEGNHYHLHEFAESELNGLLLKRFKYTKAYYQGTWKYVAIGTDPQLKAPVIDIPTSNYAPLKRKQYLYFYILCSNREIRESILAGAAIGEHYSDRRYIGSQMQHEKNIQDYQQVVKHLELLLAEKERLLKSRRHVLVDKVVNGVYKIPMVKKRADK